MMEAYCPNEDGSELIKQGDELDKLASNIAMFRNAAGVHYRSDAEVGIDLLECAVYRYCQNVTFRFHKRNGELVK